MDKRIVIPRIVVRPILPPPLEISARIRPQWLHWQVGRYREKLSFGPGGKGKADIWVPEREGEQHNLILAQFYDSLIPQYGFIGSSQYAAVGTGSTAPAPSQTQLANEIGTSSSPRRTSALPPGQSNQIEPLATYGEYNVFRAVEFTEAQVGGLNLTEWGFSPVSSYNGPLMTRELFRDGLGNPVVLSLATDQRLRLFYRYKVTLGPVTAQSVTVNIGGDGPGPRTAQFILTGRGGDPTGGVNYANVWVPGGDRRGDLMVAESLARGVGIAGYDKVGLTSTAVPLTYIHSTYSVSGASTFSLQYANASGRQRSASLLLSSSQYLATIKSVFLTPATLNLVFDSGQEFTKDSLHKLFIGYWGITWGP